MDNIRKRAPGGGRKKGTPTVTTSFRVPEHILVAVKSNHSNLNSKVTEFLTSLLPADL